MGGQWPQGYSMIWLAVRMNMFAGSVFQKGALKLTRQARRKSPNPLPRQSYSFRTLARDSCSGMFSRERNFLYRHYKKLVLKFLKLPPPQSLDALDQENQHWPAALPGLNGSTRERCLFRAQRS